MGRLPSLEGGQASFSERELTDLEASHPEGLTSSQICEIFEKKGVRLSEATFRKYVQLGLVPRSRRVGRKGKHQGSLGLYPALAVRRVTAIKQMMAESLTIEEIQRSFLRWKDEIDAIERGLDDLFRGFEREIKTPEFDGGPRKALVRDIAEAKSLSGRLVERIETLERQIVSPRQRAARARAFSSGSAGGAGDLL